MILTVDTGRIQDLTSQQIYQLDLRLHNRIPQLIGWAYCVLTGELQLDFGNSEDVTLSSRINNWVSQSDAVRALRFELMRMVREWVR